MIRTKATYRMIEFVRPDCFPYPYNLDQAFGVFHWMLKTGAKFCDDSRWGRQNVLSLLSCKPSCVNFSQVEPVTSVADLRQRFHYAILSGSVSVGPSLTRWRELLKVTPQGVRTIVFPYTTGRSVSAKELDAFLASTGRIGCQLNSFHNRARDIVSICIQFHCRAMWFELQYGYEGSVWRHKLARQVPGETFTSTYRRAQAALLRLIDGEIPKSESA